MEEDWELIEASFLKQYGIRLRTEDDMSYSEFCSLLSGIMPDTPLGRIVSIRAETDREVISRFSDSQKKIRNEWILKRNQKMREDPVKYKSYIDSLQNWAKQFQ